REDLFETINRLLRTSEYEERLRRYYALTAKHATLMANKPESELAESDQFRQLESELGGIRDALNDTISEFDDDDFAAAFRDLDHETSPTSE
ncbi:MAG: HalX domain-containing protein, partial [Halovenus sp.]